MGSRHEWRTDSGVRAAVEDNGEAFKTFTDWGSGENLDECVSTALGPELVREIIRLAEENNALKVTLEESNEIEAETLAALAVLCGDGTLKECVDGCPGHLRPEAMKRFREALDHWLATHIALCILAETLYEAFHDGADSVEDLRGTLEAAGLIEMLADQTWGLTELGGRVCRREP